MAADSHRLDADPGRREAALQTLQGLTALRRHLDDIEDDALQSAREHGATLEMIASALGVTRQAIHLRLKKLNAPQALVVGVGSLGGIGSFGELADAVTTLLP